MNTLRTILTVLLTSLISIGCNNSKKTGSSIESTDEMSEFIIQAANGGMMEVELGRIAEENSNNQRIKSFGAMMVKDHGEAGTELERLAMEKNITLPDSIANDHSNDIDDLRKKTGLEFDKDYVKMMINEHQKDIRKFERAAKNFSDPDVKAFASKTLPVLNRHLDSAKAINKVVKDAIPAGNVSEGMERQTYP